jgi:hypothetical protein
MKIIKTVLILMTLFSCQSVYSQPGVDLSKPYTQGVTLKCGTIKSRYYMAGNGKMLFWGCDTSLVKYKPNSGVYQLTSDKNEYITAIPVETSIDQNNLTQVMSVLICDRGKKPSEVFKMIFLCYNMYGNEKNWTKKLLDLTLSTK